MAAAARTPTIIPAIAPPDNDELLPVVLLMLVAVCVAVGVLVLVAAEVEAALADVDVELADVDVEDVDVEETDDVVVVVSVLFSVTSYEWIYDPATWLLQGHALQVYPEDASEQFALL